jgi:hypothetical protein
MGNKQSSKTRPRGIETKRALIFAFDYSGVNKLNGPLNDAVLVTNTLINSFNFQRDNITVLSDGDILGPMSKFINSSNDGDMNVIHYSGHGNYANGTDFLVREDLAEINGKDITKLFLKALGNFLIVIDACESGSLIELPYIMISNNNNIVQVNNNLFTCSMVNFSAAGRTQLSYESAQNNGIIYGEFTYEFYNYLGKNPSSTFINIYNNVYISLQTIEHPTLNCSDKQLYYREANSFI